MNADTTIPTLVAELGAEVLRQLEERRRPRGATYRLQFNAQFTFNHATAVVPYLHSLGVTHVYASPFLTAQPGSPHGYDVCRHDQLNPEVGTAEEYAAFVAALQAHSMGQVLDVVPNHMAASTANPWWMDVLENGPSSPFAHYFDIDWQPVKDELTDKVLLPILGEQYGAALEAGQLKLECVDGAFVLRYFDKLLPIGPKSSIAVLNYRLEELSALLGESSDTYHEYRSLITALEHLPPSAATSSQAVIERQREKEVVKRRLRRLTAEEPLVAEFLRESVAHFNGTVGNPASFDRLDEILRNQVYRLCHWRAASDEVNYRRFFDVNGLAAICVEAADVFEHTHRLVMQLLARGDLDGVRIDHIDGLLDPTRYLWRLQWAYLAELGRQAFHQRQGQAAASLNDAAPMLAIACDPPALQQSSAITDAAPSAEAAGAIGAVVLEQSRVETQTITSESPPPSWTEVRSQLMRWLCERLELPFPDAELLKDEGNTGDGGATDPVYAVTTSERAVELPLYVVVEKILGPEEPLPDSWPVAGTSGYDFLQLLNGLLLDPQGLREVVRGYERFIGEKLEFSEVVYHCKLLILRFSMSSELQMLAHRLNRISEHHRRSRDFTLNMLRHALREILASFPVYRTYAGPAGVSERDRRVVNLAVARAKRRSPATDVEVFDFMRSVLLMDHPAEISAEARHRREMFAGRFQQVTSPVMAKGTEDTAFYQYGPLISVNEVGCHPEVASISVESFHRDNAERLQKFPTTMLGTSTHDTKRSEDVRARITILAEVPHLWRKVCNQWLRLNRRHHREVDGLPAPSRNDEYLFYQTLVGCWPIEPPGDAEHGELIARLQAYMEKATHEAKVSTSWVNPNTAYDEAVRDFVAQVLERRSDNRFLADFALFHNSVLDWGLYTALSQVVLKIMSPGIPDVYQSQELWDFSLVDPDNRRPVDYDLRGKLLGELEQSVAAGLASQQQLARELAARPRDARLKLYATWRLLQLRRAHPRLFIEGRYVPLAVEGSAAKHVCAFTWQYQPAGQREQRIVVVVPRLLAQFATASDEPRSLWEAASWGDSRVQYVIGQGQQLRSVFTGQAVPAGDSLSVGDLVADFPVAVLTDW